MSSQAIVSIVDYERPMHSVQHAVELCHGLQDLPLGARVVLKPNIVFWTRKVSFPKWGVITTSRVIEDMVMLLKDHGAGQIFIIEGIVTRDPRDNQTAAHAFDSLGYTSLRKRYGVQVLNAMNRPFSPVDLGRGIHLRMNSDVLESDFLVNLPCLKTHNQTVVSLGIKNLKGFLDLSSRKKCHRTSPGKNLDFMISGLAERMPPMCTLIDGIYSLERGPAFDGKMHRSNCLIASRDVLAADQVGCRILGYSPEQVPHLVYAAKHNQRSLDGADLTICGRALEEVSRFYDYDIQYQVDADGEMPVPLARAGIKGLYYRKFDQSLCTYCSGLNGLMLTAIRLAWKGTPWNRVEILTGKSMTPSSGMNKTILLGQCMVKAHKNDQRIKEAIPIQGCPPDPLEAMKALQQAGIEVDPQLFHKADELPGFFLERYQNRAEFDESFFRIPQNSSLEF